MTTFSDIFKKSFLEGFYGQSIGTKEIVVALGVTVLLSLYIFFIYRIMTRKSFYSKSFNISLCAIAVVTAAIILTIQSSIVISLGMVGALSIVRFRTAIKDPMDLIFLFWSISVGIICGAGFAEIALIASLVITAALFLLEKVPAVTAPKLLVVNASNTELEETITDIVKKHCKYSKTKSLNVTANSLNMVIEVRVSDNSPLVREVAGLESVSSVSLIAHDGEICG